MSKGLVGSFVGLTGSILKDAASYHPTATRDFERDFARIKSLAANQGIAFFTLVLPALGAIFDSALSSGRLVRTGAPLTRSINSRTVIPRLFQGIWSRLFTDDGCLRQDIDSNDIFIMRSLCYAFKKYRLTCPDSKKFATVRSYFHVDQSLPPSSHIWDGDGSALSSVDLGSCQDRGLPDNPAEPMFVFEDEHRPDTELLETVQHCADRVAWLIGDYVPSDYRFKHGPGATAEFRRGGNYKYKFPNWSSRLQRVFPADVFGIPNATLLGDGWSEGVLFPSYETHSRLIAVPKTQKGPRLIAAEPTCHQWCQQNVNNFLTLRIRDTWLGRSIDFRRQDLSGRLARASSADGSHATLDLKEASDRLSTWLVQRVFRKNIPLLEALIVSRTRYIQNHEDKTQPSLLKIRKFASAGSALTFPIQSLVFLTICLAAGHKTLGIDVSSSSMKRLSRQVRVYGDDLIVPVSWVPRVREALHSLYLKVNDSKSYWNGKFRESCGTDAYDGDNVSPAYVRDMYSQSKPSSIISVVDTANNLFKKGLWHASTYLMSSIPRSLREKIPLVPMDSGSFGFVSTSGWCVTGPNRFNRSTHRWEALSFTLRSKSDETKRHEGAENLLQYFTEARSPSRLPHLEEAGRRTGFFSVPESKLTLRWVPVG